jgi:hypothetical protein
MSYEPLIICDYVELKNIESKMLEYSCSNKDDNNKQVSLFLLQHIKNDPIPFKGENLLLFRPELTNFNKIVRQFLDKHNVYYMLGD